MGERGNWTPNWYVIRRLEVIGAVLLKLQALLWGMAPRCLGHSRRFGEPWMSINTTVRSSYLSWRFVVTCLKENFLLLWELAFHYSVHKSLSVGPVLYTLSIHISESLSLSLSQFQLTSLQAFDLQFFIALLLSSIHSVSPVHSLLQHSFWQYLLKRVCYEGP
jgi:hypothetical protein